MPTIQIHSQVAGPCLMAEAGTTLYALLSENGIHLDAPCGGKCYCGKCKVKVEPPLYEEMSAEERALLSPQDMQASIRLACGYKIRTDAVVTLLSTSSDARIASEGRMLDPDFTILSSEGIGAAVDIGTTTVAAYLYDLSTGALLDQASALNPQSAFGADVITRIQYTTENEDGLCRMQRAIAHQIEDLLASMTDAPIQKVCIAGNTTMLHLLAGVPVASLAVAPFTPVFLETRLFAPSDLHMKLPETCEIQLLPSISTYVGADITAGILASGFYKSPLKTLFIDIGTNGEMALGNQERILCCATAAGPALEGAKISCGMGGVTGAISKFAIENGEPTFEVLGGGNPTGICGSGIVDIVASLVDQELVDETGYLEEDYSITGDIVMTPRDIREIQLAKSAIASGVEVLCKEAGISILDIDLCILAGGFGSFMNKESACRIGLLPAELRDKILVAGNTSGMGASMCLLNPEYLTLCQNLTQEASYIELSGRPDFEAAFVDNMFFESSSPLAN